jgi:hypothetical protein
MDEGYVVDFTHGGYRAGTWVADPPEKSFWTGVKLTGHAQLPIRTYRCRQCGYLESYAQPES